ncbi:MAG: hypothetical protein F6K09_03575, partial [Merismopedia sp. SIO2A8]|nr:hypothetical protein [Merismopedia sp. SIO2A8]
TNAHLYKTFGWARYEQGRLLDAEAQLNLAITFEEKAEQPTPIGHTHCLLAQTLEDLGKADEVALHWQLCLGFSNAATNPEEEEWVDIARQKALDQWHPTNGTTEN